MRSSTLSPSLPKLGCSAKPYWSVDLDSLGVFSAYLISSGALVHDPLLHSSPSACACGSEVLPNRRLWFPSVIRSSTCEFRNHTSETQFILGRRGSWLRLQYSGGSGPDEATQKPGELLRRYLDDWVSPGDVFPDTELGSPVRLNRPTFRASLQGGLGERCGRTDCRCVISGRPHGRFVPLRISPACPETVRSRSAKGHWIGPGGSPLTMPGISIWTMERTLFLPTVQSGLSPVH